jgi:hypothetical protein
MVSPHEGSEIKAAAVTMNIFYEELMNNWVLNSILFCIRLPGIAGREARSLR